MVSSPTGCQKMIAEIRFFFLCSRESGGEVVYGWKSEDALSRLISATELSCRKLTVGVNDHRARCCRDVTGAVTMQRHFTEPVSALTEASVSKLMKLVPFQSRRAGGQGSSIPRGIENVCET